MHSYHAGSMASEWRFLDNSALDTSIHRYFSIRNRILPKLQPIQSPVQSLLGKEGLVAARLANLTLVHHQDPVYRLDGRQPVRNDKRGPAHHDFLDSITNLRFCPAVN